ncbi:DUF1642 domain-containing protein [Lentilactobacillus kefiri]|uniref:DUF1642 domain-containing protein n=1 Tax=Lentilactobacillus kefiri TaxID=33962 RepID=UPI0021C28CF7|nr:DUF1642 domain-containing protein [Lentilactobacillus kefiri]MCP9369149.1 hypothetical protein [Lentilactobacillus kefiri]
MIKTYRKTATIKAEQFDGSNDMINKYHIEFDDACGFPFRIETMQGWIGLAVGDWVATGVNGEHWPIYDYIFWKTYAELPAIPKVWGDAIEKFKANHYKLSELFNEWEWNYYEQELIARAWLDGYRVEEDK